MVNITEPVLQPTSNTDPPSLDTAYKFDEKKSKSFTAAFHPGIVLITPFWMGSIVLPG
jgi:hypothetical protein